MLLRLVGVLALVGAAVVEAAIPVTGVTVNTRRGNVPLRLNINDMYAAGGAQWDLFIRALKAMYDEDPADPLSFFQISGIHGKPYIEWNDAGPGTSDGWQGYCPHGERLFVSWHRPYVLLFEQVLVDQARRIAQEYPRRFRSQYVQAAENLRMPYWDWAATPAVPPATVPETLTIRVPNRNNLQEVQLDNPLRTYRIPDAAIMGNFGGTFDPDNRTQTNRCLSPESYPDSANARIQRRPYMSWVYDAFTHSENFNEFASTGDGGGVSLEQIHNGIHWDGACGNQFVQAEFSAFDPLFMLHHCQMDRLWAYWQAMRPDEAIFNDSYAGGSRFSTPYGTTITPDSPLEPFFATNTEFHTTRSMSSIRGLGYSYSGLEYWRKNDDQMARDARRIINRLYNPNRGRRGRLGRRAEQTTRYFAQLEVNVEDVQRPCSINLFVNDQRVGSFVVMQQPETGVVHGGFALDNATEHRKTGGDSTDSVVDSIKSGLRVEIVKIDGTILTVPDSLKIQLEDVQMVLPDAEDELPEYGTPRRRPAPVVEKPEPEDS